MKQKVKVLKHLCFCQEMTKIPILKHLKINAQNVKLGVAHCCNENLLFLQRDADKLLVEFRLLCY